jgi:hypothetical protein
MLPQKHRSQRRHLSDFHLSRKNVASLVDRSRGIALQMPSPIIACRRSVRKGRSKLFFIRRPAAHSVQANAGCRDVNEIPVALDAYGGYFLSSSLSHLPCYAATHATGFSSLSPGSHCGYPQLSLSCPEETWGCNGEGLAWA